ncbi:MAG: O-acetyl-ADP-ribose deacetylase [Rubricoccaceae bacterium]|nr:O-acetyl-ADP-ribose deacetylase [Rubricoccaceae bacterium]
MTSLLPTSALTPSRVPGEDAPDAEVIRFAQTLDGYAAVGGGDVAALGRYVQALDPAPPEALGLDDLRILLFARQRAHSHQGGGWPGEPDRVMQEMRRLTALIRTRVEERGQGVAVWRGDLTRLDVDAIVNAANERMLGGGGVDGAIHRAAGPELLAACRAVPEVRPGVRCPTGEARLTPGFDLPARFVIHTVGPVWRGGAAGEPAQLASAYRAALTRAAEHDLESVAFPAISTGVYGYPPADAARVAVVTVRAVLAERERPLRVLLVAYDAQAEEALEHALAEGEES